MIKYPDDKIFLISVMTISFLSYSRVPEDMRGKGRVLRDIPVNGMMLA